MPRRGVATLVALIAALVAPAHAERLAPGEPILVAAENARAVVVGTIERTDRLDARGYSAVLKIERVVHGVAGSVGQTIAWEQPASLKTPRLEKQRRVLVALDPLRANTLWQNRSLAPSALVVAGGGFAYLADPGDASIELVAEYLRLTPSERLREGGLVVLSRLVADGDPVLAAAALRRLGDAQRDPPSEGVTILARSAADTGVSRGIRAQILRFVSHRRLHDARPTVLQLADPGSDLEPEALDTLAALDGELDPSLVERLAVDGRASHRAVGARHARGALAERVLPGMVRTDPDPNVRAAAATSLAAAGTTWGLAVAIEALADSEPEVRSAASVAIARLGEVAVPPLRAEIDGETASAPGAIATLAIMGATGRPTLVKVAQTHESKQLRGLALFALGQVRDEHH